MADPVRYSFSHMIFQRAINLQLSTYATAQSNQSLTITIPFYPPPNSPPCNNPAIPTLTTLTYLSTPSQHNFHLRISPLLAAIHKFCTRHPSFPYPNTYTLTLNSTPAPFALQHPQTQTSFAIPTLRSLHAEPFLTLNQSSQTTHFFLE